MSMREETKKTFCIGLASNLEGTAKKDFIEISLKALESTRSDDWEVFWTAVSKLEKALSIYDKLHCDRFASV